MTRGNDSQADDLLMDGPVNRHIQWSREVIKWSEMTSLHNCTSLSLLASTAARCGFRQAHSLW